MSLLFSEVTFRWRDGDETLLYESGHPDEYDTRELLKHEDRYAAVRSRGLAGVTVQVQHYRYLGGSTKDWLAEQEHIALMEAYNEAVSGEPFPQRDDVEHQEYFAFQIEE
ncbi:hypothetical protein [uncultured Oscillibacter sp.]|uniref:hypothetical protein n=1 Tax=uncultured Oscillibacter sp. TaxID=876091 RepID=UPI002619CA5A|nr:hypothetical protein [uncultured Oscillibacter sp.]